MSKPRTLEQIRRPGRDVAGLLAEIMAAQMLGIEGKVEIEMIDPRTGKVQSRQEAPNYVNVAQWEAFAESLQKQIWTYGYQGIAASTVTNRPSDGHDPRLPRSIRNDHLACWTDSTAEDSADDFAFGEVVAWAHRWQQGSPSTRQGLVQPTLCTLTDDAVSWVWEWATANGNGTFQSVGWRRLAWVANSGDTLIGDPPYLERRVQTWTGFTDAVSASTTVVAAATAGPNIYLASGIYYDAGSGKLYGMSATSNGNILLSSVVTIDPTSGNLTYGAVSSEAAAAFATSGGLGGANNQALATRACAGFTRMGAVGDWIGVGSTGNGTARRPWIRRVTNAGVTSYTNANAGTYAVESLFNDVTYDGTNLWVAAINHATGPGFVHRIDPATGTISATISAIAGTPAYFPAISSVTHGPCGIEWDAVNGWLWVMTASGYVYNIDTSGNWLGVLLFTPTGSATATLTGQHTGTMSNAGSDGIDPAMLIFAQNANSNTTSAPGGQGTTQASNLSTPSPIVGGLGSRMVTIDGDVWMQEQNVGNAVNTATASTGIAAGPAGSLRFNLRAFTSAPNFSSRSLLGAPAIKGPTQTMRIRYTMTFT